MILKSRIIPFIKCIFLDAALIEGILIYGRLYCSLFQKTVFAKYLINNKRNNQTGYHSEILSDNRFYPTITMPKHKLSFLEIFLNHFK